jgi:ABC-2 type transport system permease protein
LKDILENVLIIYVKEFRQLRRDKLTLSAIVVTPVMMLLLYGYALNFDVKHVRMGVLDESQTKESRELIRKFLSTEYFDFVGNVPDENAVDKFIQDNKATVVLVIPLDYAKRLLVGKSESVQFLIDGSNSNTATIVMGYAEAIAQDYSSDLIEKYLNEKGFAVQTGAIDFRPRVFYNPELKSMKYLIPGLVAFVLAVLVTLIPAISIVREKERGTMEHMMLAPVRPFEIIFGKTLLYFILSLLATFIVLVASVTLFKVPVNGSVFLLSFTIVLFLIAGLGIGILISTFTASQAQAYLAATTLSNLPNLILSGFIYPISSMPVWLRFFTYFFPARYFIASLRGILLRGATIVDIWDQIIPLILFASIIPLVASYRLKVKGI